MGSVTYPKQFVHHRTFKRHVEISDTEAWGAAGVNVDDPINVWGEKLRPLLIHHGMNPEILEDGSTMVTWRRNDDNTGTIFEDLT